MIETCVLTILVRLDLGGVRVTIKITFTFDYVYTCPLSSYHLRALYKTYQLENNVNNY